MYCLVEVSTKEKNRTNKSVQVGGGKGIRETKSYWGPFKGWVWSRGLISQDLLLKAHSGYYTKNKLR